MDILETSVLVVEAPELIKGEVDDKGIEVAAEDTFKGPAEEIGIDDVMDEYTLVDADIVVRGIEVIVLETPVVAVVVEL